MTTRNRISGGFTVAELIVAMLISAVTLLSGYECFVAMKGAGDRQSEDLAARGAIVHGLDRIREDLFFALAPGKPEKPAFVGNSPAAEGDTGPTRLLSFYSLCPQYGDDRLRGLRQICQVTYDWVKTGDSFCLYRCVVPEAGPKAVSDREMVLDDIERIEIAFHDGEEPQRSFSSEKELPIMVELTMTAHGQTWPLSVRLPCGGSRGPR